MPEGYRDLEIGMDFERAVKAFIATPKHEQLAFSIQNGDVYTTSSTSEDIDGIILPAQESSALEVIRKEYANAETKLRGSVKGKELEDDLSRLHGHAFSGLTAYEPETSPFERVELSFDAGKLYSVEFSVRGNGTAVHQKMREQLVAKLGNPAEHSSKGDHAHDTWHLCERRQDYELVNVGGLSDGVVMGVQIKISAMSNVATDCPSVPKL